MKHYQIIIAILAVAVSFVSCGSSGDDEIPTYVEPTYTQHEDPQWEDPTTGGGSSSATPYPGDMTVYLQLPDSLKAYMSNADKLAAFCGSECRGVASRPANDEVWLIRIYGDVNAKPHEQIKLRYYCATNKYMYSSVETIEFKGDGDRIGTYDEPRTVYFIVDK